MKKWLIGNAFILWMFGVILFAWVAPGLGGSESPVPIRQLRTLGVFFIFFTQGVQLPGEQIRSGLLQWRLHLLVQLSTYVLFPVLTGMWLWSSSRFLESPELRLGFWFLSLLPTTITSAVALTSLAGGNVTGALFNCTLSSVIGVVSVPIVSVMFLGAGTSQEAGGVSPLVVTIGLTLLLPMVLGQLLRPWLNEGISTHSRLVRRTTTGVILFMVWGAFCQSFLRGVWRQVSSGDLLLTAVGVLLLFALVSGVMWRLSARIGLDPASRSTAVYCGGQKTLAMGLPMAVLLFGSVEGIELSLLLVPLLLYHPAQLILGGILVPRF